MKVKVKVNVKVNVYTRSEFSGDANDYAEVEITDRLIETVLDYSQAMTELGADFLHKFDYSPDFHFVDKDTRVDVVQLVVSKDGEFWWEGYIKNTDIRWETGRIPPAIQEESDGDECDLREYKKEGEEDEGASHGH